MEQNSINENYNYLLINNIRFWTMSPASNDCNSTICYPATYYATTQIYSATNKPFQLLGNYVANAKFGVRPVINIKEEVNIKYGIGTKENPYTIEKETGSSRFYLCFESKCFE